MRPCRKAFSVQEKKHFFYGWVIVFLCSVVILIHYGIGYNILTAFNIPICESTGITRQEYAVMYTLMSIGQIAASLQAAKIIKRIGLMNFIRAGSILFILTTLFSCFVRTPLMLWLVGLIYGPTFISGGFFALSIIIANWFKEKRGTATGIVFMSSGLGSVFMLPLANTWIESFGWQKAKLMFTLISLVLIPVVFFLLKEKPEDMGLRAYGADSVQTKAPAEEDLWGYERKDLYRLPGAWLFLLFIIGTNFTTSTGNTMMPYLRDLGYSSAFATRVQSLNMLSLAIGRISAGFLSDKFSVRKSGGVCVLLSPLMIIGAMLCRDHSWGIPVLIVGYGIAMAVNSVFVTLLTGKIFGRKYFSSVYGLFSSVGALMGASSPLIYGRIFAQTGSYYPAYTLYLGIVICGVIAFFAASAITKPKKD